MKSTMCFKLAKHSLEVCNCLEAYNKKLDRELKLSYGFV
jgi:hypothetical protein